MIAERQRIQAALAHIPAHDRDTWLRVGMGIKAELGDDGYALWSEWSQQDESFNERDANNVWKSIRPNGRVTIGTVFHEAQQHGYKVTGTYQRLGPAEIKDQRQKREARTRQAELEERQLREQAKAQAEEIWKRSSPVDSHEYLTAKSIKPCGTRLYRGPLAINGLRCDGCLIVPLRDIEGVIWTLEFISPAGEKRFLPNGAKSGHYFALPGGDPEKAIIIAEGAGTAASISQATGTATAAAIDAGNLKPVALVLRVKYPNTKIIIAADNDCEGERNVGIEKARVAAEAVSGLVAVPELNGIRCDFNDVHQQQGAEVVKAAIENAEPFAKARDTQAVCEAVEAVKAQAVTERATVDGVRLLRASGLKPEPINWLWRGYLARGKLHIAAGAPGGGKTTIALAVAASVTAGGRWPDGSRAKAGNVLIWSGEDDPADTLLPRLIAMGADTSRVYFVGDVLTAGEVHPFDPAIDMPALELAAAEVGTVSLLIVDPIVNAVAGDGHHNTEVRRSLQPVVDLAARLGAAVLGISHFSKGTAGREPVERVTGSVAFGALPRVVFAVAKTTDEAGNVERIFVRAKSNIGPDGGGFGYALEQSELTGFPGIVASRVLWGQALDGTARDLLATAEAAEDRQERSATDEAVDWLRELLQPGPMKASEAQKNARQAGISDKALRTARERLGIRPRKCAFSGGWEWALPIVQNAQDAEDAQDLRHKKEGIFGDKGHLRGESSAVEVEI